MKWMMATDHLKVLGPVVQSIVSLTSSLRGQLVKSFTTLQPNTLKFLVEKMRTAKACHIFSRKNIGIFEKLPFENLMKKLTNKVVSFEQPGSDIFAHQELKDIHIQTTSNHLQT